MGGAADSYIQSRLVYALQVLNALGYQALILPKHPQAVSDVTRRDDVLGLLTVGHGACSDMGDIQGESGRQCSLEVQGGRDVVAGIGWNTPQPGSGGTYFWPFPRPDRVRHFDMCHCYNPAWQEDGWNLGDVRTVYATAVNLAESKVHPCTPRSWPWAGLVEMYIIGRAIDEFARRFYYGD